MATTTMYNEFMIKLEWLPYEDRMVTRLKHPRTRTKRFVDHCMPKVISVKNKIAKIDLSFFIPIKPRRENF